MCLRSDYVFEIGSSGGNTTMADKDTDEDSLNQDGSNGSENEVL